MAQLKTIECACQKLLRPAARANTLSVTRTELLTEVSCSMCRKSWDEAGFIEQYKQWKEEVADSRLKDYQWMERRE